METNKETENKELNKTEKTQTIKNEKMAVKFPDWDLLPPSLLVQRGGKNET